MAQRLVFLIITLFCATAWAGPIAFTKEATLSVRGGKVVTAVGAVAEGRVSPQVSRVGRDPCAVVIAKTNKARPVTARCSERTGRAFGGWPLALRFPVTDDMRRRAVARCRAALGQTGGKKVDVRIHATTRLSLEFKYQERARAESPIRHEIRRVRVPVKVHCLASRAKGAKTKVKLKKRYRRPKAKPRRSKLKKLKKKGR